MTIAFKSTYKFYEFNIYEEGLRCFPKEHANNFKYVSFRGFLVDVLPLNVKLITFYLATTPKG
jgi:hypothetical protein